MPRVLKYAAGTVWFLAVFWLVLGLTFPSDSVSRRIAYEVDQATNGGYELTMSDIEPWWFGLSARNMIVSRRDTRQAEAEAEPFFFADAVAVRVGVFSLLRRTPFIQGVMALDDASLSADAYTAVKDGDFKIRRLSGAMSQMSLGTLISLLGNGSDVDLQGSGGLDLSFDLKLADGLEAAEGEILLSSDSIRIDQVAAPSYGLQDQLVGLSVDELDLRLRGENGELEILRGAVRSNLLDVDMEGQVTLADRIDRSRLKMEIEVGLSDWAGTDLEVYRLPVEGAMRSAKWSDETYHYAVSTTLGRLSANDLRPERERSSRSTRPDATRDREDRRPPSVRRDIDRPSSLERPESVSRAAGSALEERRERDEDFEDEDFDEDEFEDEELDDGEFLDDEMDDEEELDEAEMELLDEDF